MMKAIYILIFLVLSLLSVHHLGGVALQLPINLSIWFLTLVFVAISFNKALKKGYFLISKFSLVLIASVWSIFLFSLINFDGEIKNAFFIALGFLVVSLYSFALDQWIIKHTQFLKILMVFVAVGFVHALVSIIQVHDSLQVWYHLTGYPPLFYSRDYPIGIVHHSNMNAVWMVLISLSSLYLYAHRSYYLQSIFIRFGLFLTPVLSMYVLFLGNSRAAWIGFFIGFTVLIISRYKFLVKNKIVLIQFASIVFLAWLLHIYFSENSGQVINKLTRVVEGGDTRHAIYIATLDLISRSFWFGYGLDSFTRVFNEYYLLNGLPDGFSGTNAEKDFRNLTHPHNELLYWVFQAGILGLVIPSVFIIYYFKYLRRQRLSFSTGVLALSFPILFQMMVSLPILLSAFHIVALIFLLRYSVKNNRRIQILEFKDSNMVFFRALLFIVVCFAFFIYISELLAIKSAFNYEFKNFYDSKYVLENYMPN